jgi:hypothetical protein
MYRRHLVQIRHGCRRLLGILLSMIRLHRVEFVSIDGVEWVRKRRRCFAYLIIPPGNLFLKIIGSPMIVLPSARWLEWERAIETSTQRNLVSTDPIAKGTCLLCRRVPGISLRQVLADPDYSPEQKSDAIRWSLAALRLLHQSVVDWGRGIRQSISHGDATASNVIVDVDNRAACWIDFDTRHQPNVPEADRRTDDLRSLIYSSAVNLPASGFPELADILVAAKFDDAIVRRFRQRLTGEWSHLTAAQLAQAPLQWSAATALRAALLRALAVERHAIRRWR